jgi:hypothetical protein
MKKYADKYQAAIAFDAGMIAALKHEGCAGKESDKIFMIGYKYAKSNSINAARNLVLEKLGFDPLSTPEHKPCSHVPEES